MKLFFLLGLFSFFSVQVDAQSFPENLRVIPVNEKLEGHRWSYRQGLDFDIVNHRMSDGSGIQMYIDVSEKTKVSSTDFVYAVVMGAPTKLYERCKKGECKYTVLVKTGVKSNQKDIWVQIWVNTKKSDLDLYLDWLEKLTFVPQAS